MPTIGLANKSQERRILIGSLVFDNEVHYTQTTIDVQIDHDNNDSEIELWRSKPEVFWGLSKEQLLSNFNLLLVNADAESSELYNSAINQLENEV